MRQDDRPGGRLQQGLFIRSELAENMGCIEIPDHDGQRLAVAMLAIAQTADSCFIGRVDGEVETTNALDRENLPSKQALDCLGNGIGTFDLAADRGLKPDVRSASPAGIWLSVETAVERIVVFSLTLGTHREDGHRCLRTVVRDAASDGETRPTVGAIQEWVAVPAVAGVEEFAKAIGAGSGIGRDAGAYAAQHLAGDDTKASLARERKIRCYDRIDSGERWSFAGQALQKCFNAGHGPFKLDDHAVGVVSDEACEVFFGCEVIDEGPEPDTLNDTPDPDTLANHARTGVIGDR